MVIKAVLFDLDGTFADTRPTSPLAQSRARHAQPSSAALELLRPQASHGSRGLIEIGFGIEPGHPTTTRCATSSSTITGATSACIHSCSETWRN